jgi:hypothetical protein
MIPRRKGKVAPKRDAQKRPDFPEGGGSTRSRPSFRESVTQNARIIPNLSEQVYQGTPDNRFRSKYF